VGWSGLSSDISISWKIGFLLVSFRIPAPRVLAQHALCPCSHHVCLLHICSKLMLSRSSLTHRDFPLVNVASGSVGAGPVLGVNLLSFCILSPSFILLHTNILQALFFFFPLYLSSPLPTLAYLSCFLSRFPSLLFLLLPFSSL